jgi:hypothetical protein
MVKACRVSPGTETNLPEMRLCLPSQLVRRLIWKAQKLVNFVCPPRKISYVGNLTLLNHGIEYGRTYHF